MHIHLPKPLHGWREFVGEVGIIVVGVLIAIGFEQLVEEIHWRNEAEHARTAIADDMAETNKALAFRAASEQCIARRINELDTIIEQIAGHTAVPPITTVIPDIGNGLFTAAWEANKASQTLTHLNRRELNLYGEYYLQLENVQRFMSREVEEWGILRVMEGDPNRLGPADIAGLRVAIQHAKFDNYLIGAIAKDELRTARALHISVPDANPNRVQEVCRPLRPQTF
jgi:hypothetical protein